MSLQWIEVSRSFGQRVALERVSLHVRQGDCYGFIGHNGAGKTTALRIALGLDRPDAGRVLLDGIDVHRHAREARARMGGLIEVPGFHGQLDAAQNLLLLAGLQGLAPAAGRRESQRVLELVGLARCGDKPVRAFSQGMRQRLGIAQALLGRPAYVLLDEPTNGLDPEGLAQLRELLRRLVREEGLSLLISSHQLHELSDLCNRIGVLRDGRLLVEAPTQRLLAAVPGRFELRTSDDLSAAKVLRGLGIESQPLASGGLILAPDVPRGGHFTRALLDAGIELEALGAQQPSLEEIYLRQMAGEVLLAADVQAQGEQASPPAAPVQRRAAGRAVQRVLNYELARGLLRWNTPALLCLPSLAAGASVYLAHGRAAQDAEQVASGALASSTAVSGFAACAAALGSGLPLLALVLVGLSSQALAGELARGTLRNLLLRPLTRADAVFGKAAAGLLWTLLAYSLLVAVSLASAGAAFGFGDLVEILPNGAQFPLVAAAELWPDFGRALLAPVAVLGALSCLGLAAGALARSAAGALGLALGAVLALDLARGLARGSAAEAWLLSSYLPTPLGDSSFLHYFADRAQGISNSSFAFGRPCLGLPLDTLVPLVWLVLCVAGCVLLLRQRSIS